MARKWCTITFIEHCTKIHKARYDYTNTVYVRSSDKLSIICPIHGRFDQIAKSHIKGNGCKQCAMKLVQKSNVKDTKQIIEEFNKVHMHIYDYSKVQYVKDNIKVKIVCPKHGIFEQIPSSHKQGCGCPRCGKNQSAKKRIIPFEQFVENAIKVHKHKFTYNKDEYISYKTNMNMLCNDCGTVFNTSPQHHAGPEGTGCPNCTSSGFNPTKPAYLYYLKVTTNNNQVLYKLGITNRTVEARYNLTDLTKIEIVKQKLYEVGQDALDWETKLKGKYKEYQYKGPKILSSGNTELFTEDIIAMWNSL